jgi:hypothetical protein
VDINGNPIQRPRDKLTPSDIHGIQIIYGNEFQKTVTAVRRNSTTTDVFGRGTEGQVVWGTRTATSWTGFSLGAPNGGRTIASRGAAGGRFVGSPTVTITGAHENLFVRSTSNQVFHKRWTGSNWTGFDPLGGGLTW